MASREKQIAMIEALENLLGFVAYAMDTHTLDQGHASQSWDVITKDPTATEVETQTIEKTKRGTPLTMTTLNRKITHYKGSDRIIWTQNEENTRTVVDDEMYRIMATLIEKREERRKKDFAKFEELSAEALKHLQASYLN